MFTKLVCVIEPFSNMSATGPWGKWPFPSFDRGDRDTWSEMKVAVVAGHVIIRGTWKVHRKGKVHLTIYSTRSRELI